MASAGRILIMPKGEYNAETQYEMLDLVSRNGTSWLAKKSVKGVEPGTSSSEEFWYNMFNVKSGTMRIAQNPNGNDFLDCTLDVPLGNDVTFTANVIESDTVFVVGVSVVEFSETQTRVVIKLNTSVNQELNITIGWHN